MNEHQRAHEGQSASHRERADRICDEFERQWRIGQHPRIAEFLERVAQSDQELLLRELIALEIALRDEAGEQFDSSEYHGRFSGQLVDSAFASFQKRKDARQPLGPERKNGLSASQLASPSDKPERHRNVPDRLGDFELQERLGRGGMGEVYKARQISLEKTVAVKVLSRLGGLDSRLRTRFQIEARAAAQLQHANIVEVFSIGQEQGVDYYVMQYVDGVNLRELIRGIRSLSAIEPARAGPNDKTASMPIGEDDTDESLVDTSRVMVVNHPTSSGGSEALKLGDVISRRGRSHFPSSDRRYARVIADMMMKIAGALEHAHSLGIVHRDIKPSNLLLDRSGRVWLADFGLAQVRNTDLNLTMTGELVGTLRYMSPEQVLARSEIVDHRTDIYSLGATMYELLVLRHAHDADDAEQVIRQISFHEPPPPRRLEAAIPMDLSTITMKALAKNPDERYATATELAEDLRRFLADESIVARPPSFILRTRRWGRRHRPIVISMIAALVVASAGLAVAVGLALHARRAVVRALAQEEDAHQVTREVKQRVDALRLAGLARIHADRDPGTAMLLGIEAVKRQRTRETSTALLETMENLHELRAIRHPDQVKAADISPDGSTVVTVLGRGSLSGRALVWNAGSQIDPAQQLIDSTQPIASAVFNPDGVRVMTLAADGANPALWDSVSGRLLHRFNAEKGSADVRAFNKKGSLLVLPSASGVDASVIDVVTGNVVRKLREESPVERAFFQDGWIATLTSRGVGIWEAESGELVRRVVLSGGDPVLDAQLNRDYQAILISSKRRVACFDVSTGELSHSKQWRGRMAAWVNSGRSFVFASEFAHELHVHDRVSGMRIHRLSCPDYVDSIAVSPNQRWIAAATERSILIWDAETGRETARLLGHEGPVGDLRFAGDDQVFSRSSDGSARVWSRLSIRQSSTLHGGVGAFVFGPDQNLYFSRPQSETLVIRKSDGEIQATLPGVVQDGRLESQRLATLDSRRQRMWSWHPPYGSAEAEWQVDANSAGVSADGGWLAAVLKSGVALVRDAEKGLQWQIPLDTGAAASVLLHPRLPMALAVGLDGTLIAWDLEKKEQIRAGAVPEFFSAPRFSPDGKMAYGIVGKRVSAISFPELVTQWTSSVEQRDNSSLVVNGKYVASFRPFQETAVQVWDGEDGRLAGELAGPFNDCRVAAGDTESEFLIASATGGIRWQFKTKEVKNLTGAPLHALQVGGDEDLVAVSDFSFDPLRQSTVWSSGQSTTNKLLIFDQTNPQPRELDFKDRRIIKAQASSQPGFLLVSTERYTWFRNDLFSADQVQGANSGHAAPISAIYLLKRASQRDQDASFSVLTVSWDGTVGVWSESDGTLERRLLAHPAPILVSCLNEKRGLLATCAANGDVAVWDVLEGKKLAAIDQDKSRAVAISFSHTGELLLIRRSSNVARVWRLPLPNANALQRPEMILERPDVGLAKFAPEGPGLVLMDGVPPEGRGLRVYKDLGAGPGDPVDLAPKTKASIIDGDISPLGDRVLYLESQAVRVFDRDGTSLTSFVSGVPDRAARFSRGGASVLTNSFYNATLWNVASGKAELDLHNPRGLNFNGGFSVLQPASPFSADSATLLSLNRSQQVRLWTLDPLRFAVKRTPRSLTASERRRFEIE